MSQDFPDYSLPTIPGIQTAREWAPLSNLGFYGNLAASGTYHYEYTFPDEDYVYTLCILSGFTNSTEPTRVRLQHGSNIIGEIRRAGGFFIGFNDKARVRYTDGDTIHIYIWNHRATTIWIEANVLFFREVI